MLQQEISITLAAQGSCTNPSPAPVRVTLGRFPAGRYTVRVMENVPGAVPVGQGQVAMQTAVIAFTVDSHSASPATPREDYSGEWLTNLPGEGVAVSQYGAHMFMTWTTYDDQGRSTWYVVPDAVYQPNAPGGPRFSGTVYSAWGARVNNLPFGVFQGVLPLGTATFVEGDRDEARMELRFGVVAVPIVRTLNRMRF
jgi:hypothetical protein